MATMKKYYGLLIFIYFGYKLGENVQIKDAIDGLFCIICNDQQQAHKFITIHPTISHIQIKVPSMWKIAFCPRRILCSWLNEGKEESASPYFEK